MVLLGYGSAFFSFFRNKKTPEKHENTKNWIRQRIEARRVKETEKAMGGKLERGGSIYWR